MSVGVCLRFARLMEFESTSVGLPDAQWFDVAMVQLAASLWGIDNECEVGEFQALEGDPTIGARIENGWNGWIDLNREPGWA